MEAELAIQCFQQGALRPPSIVLCCRRISANEEAESLADGRLSCIVPSTAYLAGGSAWEFADMKHRTIDIIDGEGRLIGRYIVRPTGAGSKIEHLKRQALVYAKEDGLPEEEAELCTCLVRGKSKSARLAAWE